MPIYVFECKNGHNFEKLLKLDEAGSKGLKCPECKSATHRVYAADFSEHNSTRDRIHRYRIRKNYTNW